VLQAKSWDTEFETKEDWHNRETMPEVFASEHQLISLRQQALTMEA